MTESQQAPVLAAFYLAYVRNPNGYGIVQSGMKISASTRLSEKLEQARADLAHVTAANLLAIEVDRQPPGQGIYGVHPDAFFDLIDGAGDASPS